LNNVLPPRWFRPFLLLPFRWVPDAVRPERSFCVGVSDEWRKFTFFSCRTRPWSHPPFRCRSLLLPSAEGDVGTRAVPFPVVPPVSCFFFSLFWLDWLFNRANLQNTLLVSSFEIVALMIPVFPLPLPLFFFFWFSAIAWAPNCALFLGLLLREGEVLNLFRPSSPGVVHTWCPPFFLGLFFPFFRRIFRGDRFLFLKVNTSLAILPFVSTCFFLVFPDSNFFFPPPLVTQGCL